MTASPFELSCPSKSVSLHMHAHVYMCTHTCTYTHEHMHPHMGVCVHTQPQDAGVVQPAPPLLWSIFTPVSVVGDKEELRKISAIWGRERSTPWKDLGEIVQLQGKEVHCYRILDVEKGVRPWTGPEDSSLCSCPLFNPIAFREAISSGPVFH